MKSKIMQGSVQSDVVYEQHFHFSETTKSGNPIDNPLISKRVTELNLKSIVLELSEWKFIHNHSQSCINALSIPLEFMYEYRLNPHLSDDIQKAGLKWQQLCIPKFKAFNKMQLERAKTSVFDDLIDLISTIRLREITRQLMQPELEQHEFIFLLNEIIEINGTLWDLLVAADKRIMVLVDVLLEKIPSVSCEGSNGN